MNEALLVLGCWYYVWDILGDFSAWVNSCSRIFVWFDFLVVSCLKQRKEESLERMVPFHWVFDQCEGCQTISVIFRVNITSHASLWFIYKWGVLGTRLSISRLWYYWWYSITGKLFFLNMHLGSHLLLFILCFYGVWVFTACYFSDTFWSCYYLGIIILRKRYYVSVVGMKYLLSYRETTSHDKEFLGVLITLKNYILTFILYIVVTNKQVH